MNSYAIDTHVAIKKLESAGFRTEQAEAVTALLTSLDSRLATKEDLQTAISELRSELKGDIAELRAEFAELRGEFTGLKGDNAVLQEQIRSIRVEARIVLALVFAMVVPMFLRSFGLI